MTHIEWQQLEATVARMTEAEKQRLAALIEDPAISTSRVDNPSLGLFADAPELLDEIMEGIHERRENAPFRTPT